MPLRTRVDTSIDFRSCKSEAQVLAIQRMMSLLYQAMAAKMEDRIFRLPPPSSEDLRKVFKQAKVIQVKSEGCSIQNNVVMSVKFRRDGAELRRELFYIALDGGIRRINRCGCAEFLDAE